MLTLSIIIVRYFVMVSFVSHETPRACVFSIFIVWHFQVVALKLVDIHALTNDDAAS